MTRFDYQPEEGLLGLGVDFLGWSCDLDLHWPADLFQLGEFYAQFGTLEGRFHMGLLLAGFGFYLELS